jgi:cellulose synthase (UDP-forming)
MGKLLRAAIWGGSGLLALAILTQPVGIDAQLALATSAIVTMAIVWWLGRRRYARWLFLALGSLVVIRYVAWRVTSTLPSPDQPVSFALGLLLLMAEAYCVLILVISLIINADPLERPPLPRDDDAALPTVDVFIPSYNEDETILATTIAAAWSMDYPQEKLTVWLLDDGGTDQKIGDRDPRKAETARARRASLQALCESLGARYLTRARNEHAKAGNMNSGLKAATGEIVVVFDADHAPFRSFLRETIGHFARDPKLFLVQTPHVFLNPDPIERNLRTFAVMPSENEMFYAVTQRGLDKWDASFFCGSAALLRRAALDVTGGFSGITITEDCETAFELHAKGWHSVYVDKPLIAGLQPETFESFIGQRSRWCQGMFQIMLLKNPLFKKGLKPIQKIAYLSSMNFWFFPLPRMVFTFAPLLHIFFDVKIFVSSIDEAVAYTATYMVANLMLQNYLYGRFRWPFVSELYEFVQGVYLAKAIVSVVLKPRKPTFNVTAKGLSLDKNHLSGLARPFFVIFLLLLVGAAMAFYRYFTEPGAELMLIVGLWTSFNLLIAGAALGVVAERRELERAPSLPTDRKACVLLAGARCDVIVDAVSAGGCRLRIPNATMRSKLREGHRADLLIRPLHGPKSLAPLHIELDRDAATASDDDTACFVFTAMRHESYMTLAELMYGDPAAIARFIARRRTHKSIIAGAAILVRWATLEPLRAFSYLAIAIQESRKPRPVEALNPAAAAAKPAAARDLFDVLLAAGGNVGTMTVAAPPKLQLVEPVAGEREATSAWIADLLALAAREACKTEDNDALLAAA